jgi:SAM-dependent methyltransferase
MTTQRLRRGLYRVSATPTAQRVLRPFRSNAAERHAHVGPPQVWRAKRDFQIAYLREHAGLLPEQRLLDLGCGTLRGGLVLIDYLEPGHYCGVEARAEVLDEGRQELLAAGLAEKSPTLIAEPRPAGLGGLPGPFDVAWAFSVLIHMSDDILDEALAVVAANLTPHGAFHANVNIGDRQDGAWEGFPVVHRSLAFYGEVAARHGLEVRDVGTLEELGDRSGAGALQRMLVFTRLWTRE